MPTLALRAHDVEAFRDTPLEDIHGELRFSEVATPLQAAADVVKVLGGVNPDSEGAMTVVAQLMLEWIGRVLAEAEGPRDGEDAWKNKVAEVYLSQCAAGRWRFVPLRSYVFTPFS